MAPSNSNIQNDEEVREFRVPGSGPSAEHPSHIVTSGPERSNIFMFKNNEEDTPMFPGS